MWVELVSKTPYRLAVTVTNQDKEPREFWVGTFDDPEGPFVYEEEMEGYLHLIEKSAYDELLADAEKLVEALELITQGVPLFEENGNAKRAKYLADLALSAWKKKRGGE